MVTERHPYLRQKRGEGMLVAYSVGGVQMQKRQSRLLAAALLLASTLSVSASGFAQAKTEGAMPKVGDMAPDFSLKYFDGTDRKDIKLSDYRGKKNVVLAFFVFAFTGG